MVLGNPCDSPSGCRGGGGEAVTFSPTVTNFAATFSP